MSDSPNGQLDPRSLEKYTVGTLSHSALHVGLRFQVRRILNLPEWNSVYGTSQLLFSMLLPISENLIILSLNMRPS